MYDLAGNIKFWEALLEHVTDVWMGIAKRMIDAVGSNADLLCYGEDVAFQHGPMVSHDTYTKHIKPNQAGRHFFATHAIENEADIYRLKEWLGHRSIATTERYLGSDRRLSNRGHLLTNGAPGSPARTE